MTTRDHREALLYRSEIIAVRREPQRIIQTLTPALDRLRQWFTHRFGEDAARIAIWWDGPSEQDEEQHGIIDLGVHWWDGPTLCSVLTALNETFRRGPVSFYTARFLTDAYQRASAEEFCRWTGLPALLEPPDHASSGCVSPLWGQVPLGRRGEPAIRWWEKVVDGFLPLSACPRIGPRVLRRALHAASMVQPATHRCLTQQRLALLIGSPVANALHGEHPAIQTSELRPSAHHRDVS